MIAKPQDERESFKYQESSSKQTNGGDQSESSSNSRNYKSNDNDNDSTAGSDSERSDSSSQYGGSQEDLPNSGADQIETAKNEITDELRMIWSFEENDRKKKINKMLLKWHPDKNPGQEKFAAECFKHLKKQIELFKNDPFLAGYYRSSYSPFTSGTGGTGGFGASSSSAYGSSSTNTMNGDDYYKSSRHYGSFDDLHRKGSGSPTGGAAGGGGGTSPHSSPSREGSSTTFGMGEGGPGASNLGRAGSFRQEWERRRQQKRQTTGKFNLVYAFFFYEFRTTNNIFSIPLYGFRQ